MKTTKTPAPAGAAASPAADHPETARNEAPPSPPSDEPGSRDPLDHDGDGRKGGAAPAPDRVPLVVLTTDAERGLVAGEVIDVAEADAGPLLTAEVCRPAEPVEVELARPRVRAWSP